MDRTAKLTASFNAGQAAFADGVAFSRRLSIPAGAQRDFWEAGWTSAQKAADAAYAAAAPQRRADALARRDAAMALAQQSEVDALLAGKTLTADDRLRIACNAQIGLATKF